MMENMRGYSKMRMSTNTNLPAFKPKSMDFSELIHENNFNQLGQLKIMEEEKDEEENVVIGEQFGEILRRNRSSASQRFRASEKSSSTSLHDVVRRAFSMRRPSSVAETYWRIHDTGDEAVVHGEDEEQQQQEGTRRCSKRKGKRFFKACKNFLKF